MKLIEPPLAEPHERWCERSEIPQSEEFPPTRLFGAPGGARFLMVQVPSLPGSGKDIAEGKGVHHEVESEGSWMWGTY